MTVSRGGCRWCLDLNEGIDLSIYLLVAFEKSTARTLRPLVREGDVVFDIGANTGAHTLGLAKLVGVAGRVYAFEPSDFAHEKLRRNLALNPDLAARTHALQVMLDDATDGRHLTSIYASWPLEEGGSRHPKHGGRLVSMTGAAVDRLDEFVARHGIDRLNLIKLVVDGHELPVLRGGRDVLDRLRPILVMELAPYVHAEERNSFGELVELLKDAGYRVQQAGHGKGLPFDTLELERLIPDGASMNVVALPSPRS